MNMGVGQAKVGQWYRHLDKGEIFQVTAIDERSRTVETQSFDGDLDEVDEASWNSLPLALAEPPEDWTGPIDDVETDDLGYSDTEMAARDWEAPLQPFQGSAEVWEDSTNPEERDPEGEGAPEESLALDDPKAREAMG
ncbi:MAG TPA: DUF6763 family protein [Steroidobacteraceae bacterium]|nr:DUF6763 family protein [Steroidobacteraceae bacterium]